jgi:predicted permease
MPAGFTDPVAGRIDAWVPLDLRAGSIPSNADNHYLTILARLRPGVSIQAAQAELDVLHASLDARYERGKNQHAKLYPLKDDVVGSSSVALEIMLGAVGLVLALVCVNIANLLLVRGSERARELALRSALGAGRRRLVRQMLMESLVLALAGDVAGLIVARLAMSAIASLGAGSIPRLGTLHLDPLMLGFSLLIASVSAVAFGLAPALRAARIEPGDVLREQSRSATGGITARKLRESLVVAQVALAFVLLVGAGVLIASLQRLKQLDLGIQTAGALVFEVHLPDLRYDSTARARFYDTYAAALAAIPGVRAAGGISRLPATGPYHQWGAQALTGPLANDEHRGNIGAQNRVISGEYFKAAGIPLIDGRSFDARDDASAPSRAVVSKALADKLYPGIRAVGQSLRTGGISSEIIGVVGDVAVDAEGRQDTYIYHWHTQWAGDRNWALAQVVRADGDLDAIREAARRALAAMDPLLVMFKPMTLGEAVGRGEAQRAFTMKLLAAFALVALALSALGLFGVLSYGVRLRRREFSIRMALGADGGTVRRMVLRQGLTMTGIGTVAGLAGAVALSRVMSALVFQVSPLEPVVLAGVAALIIVVSGVAAYLPAWRATTVNPRSALQE